MSKQSVSYWLKDIDEIEQQYDENNSSPEFALRISQVRKGISNFVNIVTKRDIPVKFSTGKQSYAFETDESDHIVISATNNPKKFDITVGLALHESAHLILSKPSDIPESLPIFAFLKALTTTSIFKFFSEKIVDKAFSIGLTPNELVNLLKFMVNWVEDRRIDQWMYENAVGYRGYYDAMYEEYWNHPDIGTLLKDSRSHIPLLKNYRFHVINMTNPAADPSFLPGLDEIWKLVDLSNISRLSNQSNWSDSGQYNRKIAFPELLDLACKIVEIIIVNSTDTSQQTNDEKQKSDDVSDEDESDLDTSESEGDFENSIDEIFKDQENFVNGKVNKETISDKVKTLVDALDSSSAQLKMVGGDEFVGTAKVIVYHKLSSQLINSPEFPFVIRSEKYSIPDSLMTNTINEGITMGNILAHRLQILSDESTLTYTRQDSGTVDDRLLGELVSCGMTNVFKYDVVKRLQPVLLHLSIDSSGSMDGKKWHNSMRLAVSLARAADKIRTFNIVISLRVEGKGLAHVAIIYDSRKDRFEHIKQYFPYLRATGGTPEGLCFAAIKDIIIAASDNNSRKFFLNISDGEPSFGWTEFASIAGQGFKTEYRTYHGDAAWRHTARQVADIRRAGINVLSYFVWTGSAKANERAFKQMYGKSAMMIDPTSVMDIAKTLNKLFLQN